MKREIVAGALLAVSGGYVQADDNVSGLYFGLGYGAYNVGIDDVNQADEAIQRIDDDDNAWKAFVGWRLNPYIAFELNYVDFGRTSDRFVASGSSGDYRLDLSGVQPAIYGMLPLGPIELFAKVGYYFYDVDLSVDLDDLGGNVFRTNSSDEAWSYGAGVGVTLLQRLHAKLEYEKIESDLIDDLDALWLSGAWRF